MLLMRSILEKFKTDFIKNPKGPLRLTHFNVESPI